MRPFNDSVIYFAVVDRFHNGHAGNDAGCNPDSCDPTHTDWFKYWGGDLSGVAQKLDYLKELGCSALWLTPIFDQIDGLVDVEGRGMAGYHGYWAKDFKRLDEHLAGSHEDVRVFASENTVVDRLVRSMRDLDMKLVLDIVRNHSSPSQRVDTGGRPTKGEIYDDGKLLTSYDDDKLGWYHRNGGVHDWNNKGQVETAELAGLADFNESKIGYRNYIKDAMRLWLDKGVDAFRVDTVKHMPQWFWQEFVSDMVFHKPDLFIFGEWFQGGCYDGLSVNFANKSGMGMLDFALQRGLEECLAKNNGQGFELVENVFKQDHLFDDCRHLVTFIDNHDMPRFMSAGASERRVDMALALILTCRGTPCIYYGTEQYLHNDTNGGADPYNRPMMEKWDTATPAFRLVKRLAALRRENPAIQRGSHRQKYLSPDAYAYTRVYRGSCCLTVFNRGPETRLTLEKIELPDGIYKDLLSDRAVTVRDGRIENLAMGRDSVFVAAYRAPVREKGAMEITFVLNGFRTEYGQHVKVIGNCPELGGWDLEKGFRLEYINENMWLGNIAMPESAGKPIVYKFVVEKDGDGVLYENRPAHSRLLPGEGFMELQHRWA